MNPNHRAIYFDRAPTGPAREPWLDWCRRHGIDPREALVNVGTWTFVCDDAARTISYQRAVLVGFGDYEWVTVQLEAPALPFPTESTSSSTTEE
jgi:hypothetical protein